MTDAPFALIAGGGTGGHVIPGLAVADALVSGEFDKDRVLFVGAARGVEAELVPEAGYAIELLPGRGIQRRLTAQNLGAVWGLLVAVVRSFGIVRRTKPSVVVSVGGYASTGPSLAAVILRRPLVVLEQNARAGASNRLFGRFARFCAVPFAETDLPHAKVTGNPVRPEIATRASSRDRRRARAEFGVADGRRMIAVFAGSLGASSVNQAVIGVVRRWSDRSDLHVHHVLGRRDFEALDPPDLSGDSIVYEAVEYERRMDELLAAADLAVCRSGGTTVAELAVVGVPAIFVPFPQAPRDHQTANARPLAAAGAAVIVPDAELDVDRLEREMAAILDDPGAADDRLSSMSSAAHELGRPRAAAAIAELIHTEVLTGGDAHG